MQVNIKALHGRFNRGYALDKHSISSTPCGYNESGHMQWNTLRTQAGEALYQLKYRQQRKHVLPLALAVQTHILPLLPNFGLIVPMAASNPRKEQPVMEVARALGRLTGKPVFELLSKIAGRPTLKDLSLRSEKEDALAGSITLHRLIINKGRWNALLLDDLYDTGASLDAACDVLRSYEKIAEIFVATLTWR
ncbi:amidophosphoribosyltransferase [Herbaspirillum rubrisubalbicans]|uniref:Amidophosphoribosyltransferase n=2 Tax=Herbaspirillum rubrisubalbicans TaxID=80842 RepID=A0ABX9BYD7_9BURK|nr:ComF family protein [Herbaspirillum rubrisubalbicans]MCP1575311.1 putative amidophosphoribosyltransferase [Herbaspirillum rubrisubalbicans]NQE50775.1 amidophosphoribosyltransferase [Herbaspirillum rubrisubalbicans]QJQ03801.1 ComF family protein [Herbaspirillum rubrisubalbicans Os34]RAM62993.1 amidophosphoribosyltransferase [Herbaspirillum rubrisubalbicans]RAN46765.1 amidophosphoribosyltransferase [Herbaspirillum rubrisubalbicans]